MYTRWVNACVDVVVVIQDDNDNHKSAAGKYDIGLLVLMDVWNLTVSTTPDWFGRNMTLVWPQYKIVIAGCLDDHCKHHSTPRCASLFSPTEDGEHMFHLIAGGGSVDDVWLVIDGQIMIVDFELWLSIQILTGTIPFAIVVYR